MKIRFWEIAFFTISSIFISYYVGGVGLSVFFASGLILWAVFSAYNILQGHTRYLGSLIVSLTLPFLASVVVIPQVRKITWLQTTFFLPPEGKVSDYVSSSPASPGAIRHWALLFIIGILLCLVCLCACITKRKNIDDLDQGPRESLAQARLRAIGRNAAPAVSRYVVFIPLLAMGILQKTDPIKATAFTMSGDARNNFLVVMKMRLGSSFPSLSDVFQTGRFGEITAANISTLNRTVGYPRFADQLAIRSTLVLMMCLIAASISALIVGSTLRYRSERNTPRDIAILALACFALVNPYPLAEILRSGFFSFFVGMGFMAATLAFVVSARTNYSGEALIILICIIGSFISYPLTASITVPVATLCIAEVMWQKVPPQFRRPFYLIIFATIFLGMVTLVGVQSFDKFRIRVRDSGAIQPTEAWLVVAVFVIATVLCFFRFNNLRRLMVYTAGVTACSLITIQLIRWARYPDPDPDGYYGLKFMYAGNFAVWFLALAAVGSLAALCQTKMMSAKIRKSRIMVAQFTVFGVLSTMLICAGNYFARSESLVSSIKTGWNAPNEHIVESTLQLWSQGKEDYVFSSFENDSNDRLGNFWSPFFWEPNRWELTYNGYDVSPAGLCALIGERGLHIITLAPELPQLLRATCPTALNKVTFDSLR
jgi:hypothetical protein